MRLRPGIRKERPGLPDAPVSDLLLLVDHHLSGLCHSATNEPSANVYLGGEITLYTIHLKITIPEVGRITVKPNDIIDSGSYCNIVRVENGILRKELRDIYKDDIKLQKRIRYEYENMQKLAGYPQILNVFNYDDMTHSYLMEQTEMNLAKYFQEEIDVPFEERLKIVTDILKGMSYTHSHSIIHRDLHLGSILKIGNDFVICDFGLSKDLSVIRSMKTSYTPKNNHLFVDPLALNDFTLLDKKSDIYSIGKIMDYIFTYNAPTTNHTFKTVVEPPTSLPL